MSAQRYGKVVDTVGDDWRGPLHQKEGADVYLAGNHLPRKILVAGNWLLGSINTGDSVLDLGCYGGYLYDWLIERRANRFIYTGVDFHTVEAVEAHRGSNAWFVRTEILRYLRPADYVFCARVLLHQPDPIAVLNHAATLANKAAIFVTPVWKERITKKVTCDGGTAIYRTTLDRADLERRHRIEWVQCADDPDKYSTFVIAKWPGWTKS